MTQHGYLVIQDRQPGARSGQTPPGQGEAQEPQVCNPILTSSIEMLMGNGGGAANRVEARLANWSDDGLPPVGFSSEAPGLVAGMCLVLTHPWEDCSFDVLPKQICGMAPQFYTPALNTEH